MSLPSNFSPWEHLQSVLLQSYNRVVREEFADADDDDISTPRSSLRTACLLRDDDSIPQASMRMMLYYFVLRKAADMQAPVYGIPIPGYQEARKFQPQIQLFFQEDNQDVEQGYSPVTGEISFRLEGETEQSISEAELRSIANRIRSNFTSGGGFIWRKGRIMATYTDRQRGYKLQLLCRSESEARRLIGEVLGIQNHSPDWEKMNISENAAASSRFPTIPTSRSILGRSRRMPRARPIADVRFIYAVCHIHGLPNPVVLVDRSRLFRQPLVESA